MTSDTIGLKQFILYLNFLLTKVTKPSLIERKPVMLRTLFYNKSITKLLSFKFSIVHNQSFVILSIFVVLYYCNT